MQVDNSAALHHLRIRDQKAFCMMTWKNFEENFCFLVIEPMSSVINLRLNTKPEQDGFIKPKVLLDAVFEEIAIILSRCQVT